MFLTAIINGGVRESLGAEITDGLLLLGGREKKMKKLMMRSSNGSWRDRRPAAYRGGGVVAGDDGCRVVEAVLVHDPVGLLAVRGAALVEDERLAHADALDGVVDGLVAAGGLPEAGRRGAVRARPRRVLLVLVAEEVPVVLRPGPDLTFLCTRIDTSG